jgi:hypothetical protein
MRGLLDTHTFVWAAEEADKLSDPAKVFLDDPANTIFLSAVSVWEIVIKTKLGKLPLSKPIGANLYNCQWPVSLSSRSRSITLWLWTGCRTHTGTRSTGCSWPKRSLRGRYCSPPTRSSNNTR